MSDHQSRRERARIARVRTATQAGFLLLVIYLGFEFWRFVRHFELGGGGNSAVEHPAGVEAFLPIGGLTSLKYWLGTGTIHPTHPAALFLFVGAIAVSVALKKSFCGWICPVGFISEWVYKPWKRFFGKNMELPKWLDIPLRSLKYLVLGFFLWAIVFSMGISATEEFLGSDYWKVADVKMLGFFTDISSTALTVTLALVALSIPIRNFWCRFLCPYGALLGLSGLLSPVAITRDNERCTHCRKCTRNCPAHLQVEATGRVLSPECSSCLTCVSGCPVGAISVATPKWTPYRLKVPGWSFPLLIGGVFFGIIAIAKLSGHWEARVSKEDLQRLVPRTGQLAHPR